MDALPPRAPRAAMQMERPVTSRVRGSIRSGIWENLNLKAGWPVGCGSPAAEVLGRFPGIWLDRMAEEGAVAVCVRVRPLNSR